MSDSQTAEPPALRSTVRNPRRRQRQSDVDSYKTAPRRKRSKISEDTFHPSRTYEDEAINGSIEMPAMMTNGDSYPYSNARDNRRARQESTSMLDVEMPMRSKKASLKRPPRNDGATVLTATERYSLKLLPSTPKELKKSGVEYRGRLGAAHYALAVTRQRAFIWDYTSHAPVSSPRAFDIPFTVKPTDPLPFGCLVSTGSNVETGLLLVSAASGNVIYYDSIERAASLSLFQDRSTGVEGSLGKLFNGEFVTELICADHAGFVVVLSSGRISHMTLRDSQGKPRIFAQFLKATDQTSGGIFGSIRGMLTGESFTRTVAALHTRPLGPRGPIQAISLTEKCELQTWDLHWGGQNTFNSTIDLRTVVLEELRRLQAPEMEGRIEEVIALDFAIIDKPVEGNEVGTTGTDLPVDLLILVKSVPPANCTYVLLELSMVAQNVTIGRVVELDSYSQRNTRRPARNPRLLLPKPHRTALIVFEDAVIISELGTDEPEGPEAQLLTSYVGQSPFQDTIHLKQTPGLVISGACGEDSKAGHANTIGFVEGAGLVRLSIADARQLSQSSTTPIKTRIEQAVFHGELQDGNIVDFGRTGDASITPEEIEDAALQISDEIVASTSSFIPADPASVETNLALKAAALRALVTHVRQNHPVLSQSTMWRLLWNAERVVAGQQMWAVFEEYKTANSERRQKRAATLMDEICSFALAAQTDDTNTEHKVSTDIVQHYFTHKLQKVDRILISAHRLLEGFHGDSAYSSATKLRSVLEAADLWDRSLESVFAFRMDNAAFYGILPELLQDGVLADAAEYVDLPEPWTSTTAMLKAAVGMPIISRALMTAEYESNREEPGLESIVKIALPLIPRLIQSMCLIYQERINWLVSRDDEKQRELAERLQRNYTASRHDQFRALADVAQTEAGLRLAEKYRDMETLTEMIVAEVQFSFEELVREGRKDSLKKDGIKQHIEDMQAKIGKYFKHFGDDWANAYFDQCFGGTQTGVMLKNAQEHYPEALSRYLRANPDRAKLCWIDDITAHKDYLHARDLLLETANDQEVMFWAKSVELSLSKLALLAAQEAKQETGEGYTEAQLQDAMPSAELDIANVQHRLYQHLRSDVRLIDTLAEVETATERVGLKNQDLHSLHRLLEEGIQRVLRLKVLSADELIDVLTLMECVIMHEDNEDNLGGQEFYLALKVLDAAAPSMQAEQVEVLLRIIWKRCYVYDDWVEINSSQKQSAEDIEATLRSTMPWRTLFYALDRDLVENPDTNVRILLPSECLGAGCTGEDLAYRW